MDAINELVPLRGSNQDLLHTKANMCRSGYNALTNWAIQTGKIIALSYVINYVKFGDDRSQDWGLVSSKILCFCHYLTAAVATNACSVTRSLKLSNVESD